MSLGLSSYKYWEVGVDISANRKVEGSEIYHADQWILLQKEEFQNERWVKQFGSYWLELL